MYHECYLTWVLYCCILLFYGWIRSISHERLWATKLSPNAPVVQLHEPVSHLTLQREYVDIITSIFLMREVINVVKM